MDPNPFYNDDVSWELMVSALQGELSAEEEVRFQQWLASAAANRESFERLTRIWKEGLKDYGVYADASADGAWEALRHRVSIVGREDVVGRVIRLRRWVTVAAIVFLTGAATWFYYAGRSKGLSYETANHEQKEVSLPDGSTIALQPGTRIELAAGYNTSGRAVRLVKGIAQFNVVHRNDQPFSVEMDVARVQDIGTVFTVEKTKDSIRVGVISGRIAFTVIKTGESREVAAGDYICLYTPGSGKETLVHPDSLRFENAPLPTVLAALEKWSGKRIVLADTSAAQKRLTVNLEGESLENALTVICASVSLRWKVVNGGYELAK